MKLRIMFKRLVQPPIDTPAQPDYRSIDILADEITERFVLGVDCGGCGISIDVVGVEVIKES